MEPEREPGWRVIESHIIIDTKHLRLRSDTIELPTGSRIGPYYVRETLGFAVVFAITRAGRVVLVRQYKHGIGQDVLELPAGAIDPGESPEACARRELSEETGYGVAEGPFELIGTFYADPTNSTARCYLFVARDVQVLQEQRLDETEEIEVTTASFEELRRFASDGTIVVSTHVASIFYALERLERRYTEM